MGKAYAVSKKLINQNVKPPTFTLPNVEQISVMVNSSDGFLTALKGCVDFAADNVSKFPDIKSFPVKQATITKLTTDLNVVKNLPL